MRHEIRRGAVAGVLAVLVLAVLLQAQQPRIRIDVESLGPQVGERVPDFSLPDQRGRIWTRDSILGPNGAILLFHRSADW